MFIYKSFIKSINSKLNYGKLLVTIINYEAIGKNIKLH